jgi:hypothetical protein
VGTPKAIIGFGPNGQTSVKSTRKDGNEDILGDDDAPEPASVVITGSPSENSATSDDDKSSAKTKGTAPSRERLTMQQKLKAVQHFEKNRMSQKELCDWMYKNLMLKKRPSKSAIANMFRPQNLARIKSFKNQTNPHLLQQKSSKPSHFPELEEKQTFRLVSKD